jgi:hypothetical protein
VVHPHGKLVTDVRRPSVHCRPELLKDGALRALDLAVQVRRSGWDGPELDRLGHQPALDLFGEELRTPISLDALDGERHLVENLVKEGEGRLCLAAVASVKVVEIGVELEVAIGQAAWDVTWVSGSISPSISGGSSSALASICM